MDQSKVRDNVNSFGERSVLKAKYLDEHTARFHMREGIDTIINLGK